MQYPLLPQRALLKRARAAIQAFRIGIVVRRSH
jgi:hypothetical protein